jgi:PAS domain S-box-containing protein
MDQLRESIARGDLVQDVRRLLQGSAEDHGRWLRENLRHALVVRRQDAVAISALTGLAPGTVRGFLNGRPSSIDNVLTIIEAVGYTLAELDQPPEQFRHHVQARLDGVVGGTIGASLLAFDASPTPMAITLADGKVVKVNHELRDLLGYEDGELIGEPASRFSASSAERLAERTDELTTTGATPGRLTRLRRKDGSLVSVVSSAVVVRDREGEPRYVIARAVPSDLDGTGDGGGDHGTGPIADLTPD